MAAIIVQLKEIQPVLPKIFPKEADRLAYKLALTKFVQVKEDFNAPTLLRPVLRWARKSAENNQRSAEWVRWGLYGFEFFMSMSLFGTSLFSGGVLAIAVLFLIAYGVIGCELSLRYAASEEQKRLTHRESQKYNLLKRTHRHQAEARIK